MATLGKSLRKLCSSFHTCLPWPYLETAAVPLFWESNKGRAQDGLRFADQTMDDDSSLFKVVYRTKKAHVLQPISNRSIGKLSTCSRYRGSPEYSCKSITKLGHRSILEGATRGVVGDPVCLVSAASTNVKPCNDYLAALLPFCSDCTARLMPVSSHTSQTSMKMIVRSC